jgi:hypothetical protein
MRSYRRNSPEAAARIVALVLIADGHACRSEFAALHELEACKMLGLPADALHRVVQHLCEDLLMGAHAAGSVLASVDDEVLASLMAEVDDPVLQLKVVRLAAAAAAADRHLAEGEDVVLSAASRHWHLGQEGSLLLQCLGEAPRSYQL